MTSFHIILTFIYLVSAFIFVNRIAIRITNTKTKDHLTLFAVILSAYGICFWSIYAVCVAFIPLLAEVFLNFWKKQRREQQEEHDFLIFIEKIILKMQNGNSFRASIQEIHRESDAFVQQHGSLLAHFVSFSPQMEAFTEKRHEFYFAELLCIDKKPHLALVQLKLLQKSIRLQIFFRRKSGQVSFQARFQSYFIVGIYFVILLLQTQFLGFQNVKSFFYLSLPLVGLGFYLTQRIGKKLKWNL
jgi:uncharacterized protein with PQ loop repeat